MNVASAMAQVMSDELPYDEVGEERSLARCGFYGAIGYQARRSPTELQSGMSSRAEILPLSQPALLRQESLVGGFEGSSLEAPRRPY